MRPLDLKGQKFWKLLCIKKVENVGSHSGFLWLCDCGKEVVLSGVAVKTGDRKSCGCGANPTKTKEFRDHPLYDVWKGMKARCYGKNNISYKNYGARGVRVCDEWRGDFLSFYKWCIENGWKNGLRIDKDYKSTCNGMLYSPNDCCIITHKENSQKTRRVKLDKEKVREIRESNLTYPQLAKKYAVHLSTIANVKRHKTW